MIYSVTHTWMDYPSEIDSAVSVFFSGCSHGCKGCQNPKLANPALGEKRDPSEFYDKIVEYAKRNMTDKLVLTGGDPLHKSNLKFVKKLLKINNDRGFFKVCIYTGHSIDAVSDMKISGFEFIKCGKFNMDNRRDSEKTGSKFVLASDNQNFFDSCLRQISLNGILSFG